jgi:hypothetical protein
MRRLLLVVVAATLASAQETKDEKPFKWDPRQRTHVAPGARTFFDYEVTNAFEMTFVSQTGATAVTSHSAARESYRWVRSVVGVESGQISEAQVQVERWKLDKAGVPDETLEGKTITLKKSGSKLEATIADDDGVSGDARDWLKGEVFRCSGRLASTEGIEDLLVVREAAMVTTGCDWTRDPKAVALGILQTTDVDPQRSSVAGHMGDVHLVRGVHYGKASVDAVLQVRKLDMHEIRYEDGALVEIAWRYEGSLERARRDEGSWSLTFRTTGRRKLGESLDAEMRNERTETLRCGPAKK